MKITWHGHSNFELRDSLDTIIDPFFSGNPAADVSADEVSPNVIVVTHGHADHMGDTLTIARRTGCKVVAINEIAKYLQSNGVDARGGNMGGSVEIDGTKYAFVPAVHSNGIDEAGFGWDAGSPAGIVVSDHRSADSVTVYHAGDTALFGDMGLIRELYAPRVAMLPIGGRFTMDIDQAVRAVKLIQPKFVIHMHYNTFDVITASAGKFQRMVEEQTDAEVVIMEPGDSIDV